MGEEPLERERVSKRVVASAIIADGRAVGDIFDGRAADPGGSGSAANRERYRPSFLSDWTQPDALERERASKRVDAWAWDIIVDGTAADPGGSGSAANRERSSEKAR